MKIWRRIVSHREHRNAGFHKSRHVGGRFILTLEECGHEVSRKISDGVPFKAQCYRCEQLSEGAISKTDNGDGTQTRETWDQALRLPVRMIEPSTFKRREP